VKVREEGEEEEEVSVTERGGEESAFFPLTFLSCSVLVDMFIWNNATTDCAPHCGDTLGIQLSEGVANVNSPLYEGEASAWAGLLSARLTSNVTVDPADLIPFSSVPLSLSDDSEPLGRQLVQPGGASGSGSGGGDDDDDESSSLSTGALIGIVCGCVVCVLVLCVAFSLVLRRRRRAAERADRYKGWVEKEMSKVSVSAPERKPVDMASPRSTSSDNPSSPGRAPHGALVIEPLDESFFDATQQYPIKSPRSAKSPHRPTQSSTRDGASALDSLGIKT